MRKVFALLLLLLFCGSAYAAKFPEMGICTGERVRLRQSPGTKGKILGVVEPDRNRFVILGETRADGMKWYKIDHPTEKGTAYIAADYVKITPVGNVFAEVRLTFGVYPEKTRALIGKSLYFDNEDFQDLDSECLRDKDRYSFIYNKDGIWNARIMRKSEKSIAGIHIGDRVRKLFALGMSEDELDTDDSEERYDVPAWTLENENGSENVTFSYERGVITDITWTRPIR